MYTPINKGFTEENVCVIIVSYKSVYTKKGSEKVVGRPTDDPKTVRLNVRISAEMLENIERKRNGRGLSEIIREALEQWCKHRV